VSDGTIEFYGGYYTHDAVCAFSGCGWTGEGEENADVEAVAKTHVSETGHEVVIRDTWHRHVRIET
jgi:predicted small metal-binding protein